MPVSVAIYETRHGDETRLFASEDLAKAWRREIAAENWAARMDDEKPTDPEEAAEAYFDRVGEMRGDFFRIEECTVEGAAPPPAAPSPGTVKVWTLTTDGDNMGIETEVFATEDEAMAAARDVLRTGYKAKPMPDNLDSLNAEALADLWADSFDGACIIENHDIAIAPVAPSPDWRKIAADLMGALDSYTHQIEQMRGMFDDEDGAIAQAIEDADEATEEYRRAIAGAPAAPAADPAPFVGQDDRAASEGWCIIDNENGTFSIEADHDSPIFCRAGTAYNDEAEAFVKTRAAEGSEYHKAALRRVGLLDPFEVAARAAGWVFDEPSNEYRLNDNGNGCDAIDAKKTWEELCRAHGIQPAPAAG